MKKVQKNRKEKILRDLLKELIPHPWAENGEMVKIPDEKYRQGWLAEIIPVEYLNWWMNQTDKYLNQLEKKAVSLTDDYKKNDSTLAASSKATYNLWNENKFEKFLKGYKDNNSLDLYSGDLNLLRWNCDYLCDNNSTNAPETPGIVSVRGYEKTHICRLYFTVRTDRIYFSAKSSGDTDFRPWIKIFPIENPLQVGDVIHNEVSETLSPNEIPLWLGSIWIPVNTEPEIYASYKSHGTLVEKDGKFLIPDHANRFLRITAHPCDVVEDAIQNHFHLAGIAHSNDNMTIYRATATDIPGKATTHASGTSGDINVQSYTSKPFDARIGTETYPKYITTFARKIGTWTPPPEILEKWMDKPKTKECYIFDRKTGEYKGKSLSPINWHETTEKTLVYWESETSSFEKPEA